MPLPEATTFSFGNLGIDAADSGRATAVSRAPCAGREPDAGDCDSRPVEALLPPPAPGSPAPLSIDDISPCPLSDPSPDDPALTNESVRECRWGCDAGSLPGAERRRNLFAFSRRRATLTAAAPRRNALRGVAGKNEFIKQLSRSLGCPTLGRQFEASETWNSRRLEGETWNDVRS